MMPMPTLPDARTEKKNISVSLDDPDFRSAPTVFPLPGGPTEPEQFVLRRVGALTPDEFEAFERLAFEHGEYAESYLAIEPERYCYLSADRQAAVSIVPAGRYLHIAGGILAAPTRRPQMITALAEHARRTGKVVAFYAVGEQDRPFFEAAGWEVSKFGEDTDLDLNTLRWSGKPYEWVRRQFNFCQRAGLRSREIVPQ
jgi:phosphatidylglycerol lysyltransferase